VRPVVADAQEWTCKPGRPLQVNALGPKTIGSNRVQTARSVIPAGMARKAESHWVRRELAVEAAQVALHPPSLLLVVPGDGRRGSILRWSLEHSCGGPINLAELIRRLRSEARAAGSPDRLTPSRYLPLPVLNPGGFAAPSELATAKQTVLSHVPRIWQKRPRVSRPGRPPRFSKSHTAWTWKTAVYLGRCAVAGIKSAPKIESPGYPLPPMRRSRRC
jgi:hypothetical protein